ncbi:MAG: LamG domain-containing protein [Silvibacterium sp.]
MTRFSKALACLAVLSSLCFMACAQSERPVAAWNFDGTNEHTVHDSISGIDDPISGYYIRVPGAVGNGLRFDGISAGVTRVAAEAPKLSHGLTVDAWVAVNAYPWNWVPIVEQRRKQQQGYFFGTDSFGHLSLQVSVNGQWWSLVSKEQLPLRKWAYVAGSYDPAKGMALYIDGNLVGTLALQGPLWSASGEDLVIGRVSEPMVPAQWISPTYPVWYSWDGILDEVRIYDGALSGAEIKRQFAEVHLPTQTALPLPVLPSGPAGPGRFGAYYTTLHYDEMYEKPRRVGPDTDVVVRFDQSPIRLVFWQGTNYGGDWVTENNKWYTDEFMEAAEPGCPAGQDCEPMSDKQNRYARVRILESNDARVVIHWHYGLCEVEQYLCAYPDPRTGWADSGDEYFTVYPDGVAVRKEVLWSSDLKKWHEFQETISINGPGFRPEDDINTDALTIGNMKGETTTYSWLPHPPAKIDSPSNPNIQVVNLKSIWKPFQIVSPVKSSFDIYAGGQRYSIFEWWNHWPVAQVASSGINAIAPDRPGHSSLSHIYWEPYAQTEDSTTKIMLAGLTTKSASALVPLAESWLSPPEPILKSEGFESKGYDPTQRAFVFARKAEQLTSLLRFDLHATSHSPLVNPAFVVEGWGDQQPMLSVDGKKLDRGASFRYGFIRHLTGDDLVVWVELQTEKPTRVEISPGAVKHRSK